MRKRKSKLSLWSIYLPCKKKGDRGMGFKVATNENYNFLKRPLKQLQTCRPVVSLHISLLGKSCSNACKLEKLFGWLVALVFVCCLLQQENLGSIQRKPTGDACQFLTWLQEVLGKNSPFPISCGVPTLQGTRHISCQEGVGLWCNF